MSVVLFQLNLAKMRAPFSDPLFDDFKAWLTSIHALADVNPNFLWRYHGEESEEGYIAPYPYAPLVMGNMSAWRDYDSLFEFTFTAGHMEMMKQKRKWFEKLPTPYNVLYYGDEGDLELPDEELLQQGLNKLRYLSIYGETPAAFGFGSHKGNL